MSDAMVVHVTPFFDLRHQRATAMPAAHQATEREVVLDPVPAGLAVAVQEKLNPLPGFLGDQRLVIASVGLAIEIEIAAVQALSENLVRGALVNPRAAESQNS